MRRPGRSSIVALTCVLGLGATLAGGVGVSIGRVLGSGGGSADLTIIDTGRVSYSATVRPRGHATTAHFEYGLGTRYREPKPPGIVYDESTPLLHLGPDFRSHRVFGRASKLVPNALYHVRLVASSAGRTVRSPDTTFRTATDPPPPMPQIGAFANLEPISGLVLIQPPASTSARTSEAAGPIAGRGFLPLTERRRVSIDGQIDARAGALTMVVASPQPGRTQRIRLAGGLFSLAQPRDGIDRGLTTVDLHEGEFPGAPTYASCAQSAAAVGSDARTAQVESLVLQTLRATVRSGRFRIRGHYSAAVASGAGTAWDTIDRCDGTLTVVRSGTVMVSDIDRGTTIAVDAGQSYLASALQ